MLSECLLVVILIVVFVWCVIARLLDDKKSVTGGADERKKMRKPRETAGGPREGLPVQKELSLEATELIPKKTVDELVAYIMDYGSFAPLDAKEQKYLDAGAKKFGVSSEQITAMRHVVVSQRIAGKIAEVIQKSDEIRAAHAGGKSIIDIAKDMQCPPLAIARQILLKDRDMQAVRAMLSGEEKLPADIAEQVEAAIAADHGGKPSMEKIMADAEQFEAAVAAFLKKSKVEFETEDDLKKAQTADPRFGKPVATPDFFFPKPIKVNGKLVNWLEVRNYPMFDLAGDGEHAPKIVKNVLRQSEKYDRHFGKGAFVFRGMQADLAAGKEAEVSMIDGAGLM